MTRKSRCNPPIYAQRSLDYYGDIMTVQETAEFLKMTDACIRKHCREGSFKGAFKVGRDTRIPKTAVIAFMEKTVMGVAV